MKKYQTALLLSALVFNGATHASPNSIKYKTGENNYTKIIIDTNPDQKDPLDTTLSLKIPSSIKTVGQSMNFVLNKSGYALESLKITEKETLRLYSLETSASHKRFDNASVLQIVKALAGKGFKVNINHIRRTISINPKKEEE